jgi:hypothetical protein
MQRMSLGEAQKPEEYEDMNRIGNHKVSVRVFRQETLRMSSIIPTTGIYWRSPSHDLYILIDQSFDVT